MEAGRGARFCTKFGARFVTPVLQEVRLPRPLLWFARGSASPTSPLACTRFGFPDLSSGLHEVRPLRTHLWSAKGSAPPTSLLVSFSIA
ncbi:hypothetical protein U1Q18_026048 [Sarracenia purpurea var. burkii]